MKNLKLAILAMAMVAAFASLAAATASATTLTGAGGSTLGSGTELKAENEGNLILHPPIGDIECKKSAVAGKTTNAGGEGVAVNASIESLSFTECNATVTVLVKGELSFEGTGSNNGTLKSSNTEVTIEFAGFHCIFRTSSTSLGTITGSATTGSSATLDISAEIPRTGGRAGAFCGTKSVWTGSYKVPTPSTLNIDGSEPPPPPKLEGEAPTGYVGETITVTWRNTGGSSATVNDETDSAETVAKTVGSACTTIAAGGSCTNRKVECLKPGEATLTARDTTASVAGEFKVKCDATITGEATTPKLGDTVTVTWKNNSRISVTIEDESTSNSEVAKTVGTGCETIKAESSCTNRKIECLKEGESTITARDTPLVEGEFKVKCDKPDLTGEVSTGTVGGEALTVTWKNNNETSMTIDDETVSDETVAKTVGTACGTIAGTGSCTSRKVECLKAGEATITARDTPFAEGQVTIKCDQLALTGEAPTGVVGETVTVTWKNDAESSVTIDDETVSDETVAKTVGTACGTIAGTGSCTSRKVECLKKGEATITARDTPSAEGKFVVKCNDKLEGSPTTGTVGETVTVTWTNNTGSSLTVEDESTSDGTVAETLGSSCGTIASKGSCTSRKIKCLKKGESTITAVDTPSIEGKFVIKCD